MAIILKRKSKLCPECGGRLGRMHVYTPTGAMHASCVLEQNLREYYAQHGGAPARQVVEPDRRRDVEGGHMPQRSTDMPAGHKIDPLKGLNPDQSGPKEKIQNGDPSSGPNRDQRAQTVESGGTQPSLQKGPTGTPEGQVPPHEGRIVVTGTLEPLPEGVGGETLPVGAFDQAGTSPTLSPDEPLRDKTGVGEGEEKVEPEDEEEGSEETK